MPISPLLMALRTGTDEVRLLDYVFYTVGIVAFVGGMSRIAYLLWKERHDRDESAS